MDSIVTLMMKCKIIIYTSPLLWGGFSNKIKKIVDKMALTGSVFYREKNKEFVKGTVSNMKKLISVGINDNISDKAKVSFTGMIKEIGVMIALASQSKSSAKSNFSSFSFMV